MEAIGAVLGVLVILGGLHLFGSVVLAWSYVIRKGRNEYAIPKLFVARWIITIGFLGFFTSDNDDGLFWRHIHNRMDGDRTNAYDIGECKANLRRLEALPRTDTALRAAGLERHRLATLRAHDNEVAAAIGVSVLAPDLAATSASIAAGQATLNAIRHPSDS
jgi:hypothetical protein